MSRLAAAMAGTAAASIAGCSPSPGTPFRVTEFAVDEPSSELKKKIDAERQPRFYEQDRADFYLVSYPLIRGRYVDEGLVVAGLLALDARCPYDNCRIPFCSTSKWFECPCGGDKFNRVGEYKLGPSPRGMNRFKMRMSGDRLTVLLTEVVPGEPRGVNTTGQEKEGRFCV